MDRRTALKKTTLYTGLVLSSSAIATLFQSCRQEDPTAHWSPVFLNRDQAKAIYKIADVILPSGDTPGASDLNTAQFIDMMLKDIYPKEKQEEFMTSLNAWMESSQWSKKGADEKSQLVKDLDAASFPIDPDNPKHPFYLMTKELTVLCYFTSEEVLTSDMVNYQTMPGRYDACIPLKPDDKIYIDNNIIA